MSPLDYLLTVMRDIAPCPLDAAKAAAKYVHPTLARNTHKHDVTDRLAALMLLFPPRVIRPNEGA